MQIPRYFNRRKIQSVIACFSGIFALLVFIVWAAKYFIDLRIDWSFSLPMITLIASAYPIGAAIVDWFDKRLKVLDERLDRLELAELLLKEAAEDSKKDRYDLRGRFLRFEVRLETVIRNQNAK
jgi:hypothetical protein